MGAKLPFVQRGEQERENPDGRHADKKPDEACAIHPAPVPWVKRSATNTSMNGRANAVGRQRRRAA